MDLSPRETKRALRNALLQDRAAAMASHAGPARLAIRDRYLTAFDPPAGMVVSAFWPMPEELDLRPLLEALHARGCVCALPVVVGRRPACAGRRFRSALLCREAKPARGEQGDEQQKER